MECGDSSSLSLPLPMARLTEKLSARFPHEGKESGNQFPHSKIRKRCSALPIARALVARSMFNRYANGVRASVSRHSFHVSPTPLALALNNHIDATGTFCRDRS